MDQISSFVSCRQSSGVLALQECLAAVRRFFDPLYQIFGFLLGGLVSFAEG